MRVLSSLRVSLRLSLRKSFNSSFTCSARDLGPHIPTNQSDRQQARYCGCSPFPPALHRTTHAHFWARGSLVSSFQFVASIGPSRMNVVVTFLAENECLSMASRHDVYPFGPFSLSVPLEIFECSNVMHFDLFLGSAQLAPLREESFLQF